MLIHMKKMWVLAAVMVFVAIYVVACDGAGVIRAPADAGATKSEPPTSDQCDGGLWCPPSTPDAAWE